MLKKISLGVLALISVSVIFVFIVLLFTRPQLPSETSNSYAWLQPGPYTVAQAEFEFVDKSRSTNANRDFPGAAQRSALYRPQFGFLRISQDRTHWLSILTYPPFLEP